MDQKINYCPFCGDDVSGLGVNGPANGGEQRIGRPN
jgi:hypothetical protein